MRVPLTAPVMAFNRPVASLSVVDSLTRAAEQFAEQGVAVLPVVDGPHFVGVLTQKAVLEWLDDPTTWNQPVHDWVLTGGPVVTPTDSGSAALRILADAGIEGVPIVGSQQRWVGMVYPSSFLAVQSDQQVQLGTVGGMATPFGVYLTDGAHSGGASPWALVATGAVMMTLAFIAQVAVALALEPLKLSDRWVNQANAFGFAVLFLVLLRSIPLAGIHAAEHMTVHAIERKEPLVESVVARMPRIHPRCGTNLAAGVGIFTGFAFGGFTQSQEFDVFLGAILTLFLWRPWGSFLQYWFTTRPAKPHHIQMGIAAAEDLVRKHLQRPDVDITPWRRLFLSGIPMVIAGSSLMGLLLLLLAHLFPWLEPFI